MAAESTTATALLRDAARLYDTSALLRQRARAARSGRDCAEWMGLGPPLPRRTRPPPSPQRYAGLSRLGALKYALALAGASLAPLAAWRTGQGALLLLFVPLFYAIEAQLVFLYPVALEGARAPLLESFRTTRRAGGTWVVMRRVLRIAATMLLGGFLGRGFVRSWSIGCLAICVWYARLEPK